MLDLTRRKFLVGLGLVGIAPALVQASSIMRVRPVDPMDDDAGLKVMLNGEVVGDFRTDFMRPMPEGIWRTINAGVPYSKSTTVVVTEPFQSLDRKSVV